MERREEKLGRKLPWLHIKWRRKERERLVENEWLLTLISVVQASKAHVHLTKESTSLSSPFVAVDIVEVLVGKTWLLEIFK